MDNNQVKLNENTSKQKMMKILNIVLNVFFYAFIAVVLLFAISTITKKDHKSIPNLFGKGYLVVQTDSMEGDKKENFKVDELIIVSLLDEDEKDDLQVDDIISFYDVNIKAINTHRIIGIVKDDNGNVIAYQTKGDNAPEADLVNASIDNVIAKYNGTHSMFWGKVVGFITDSENPIGFILCIVLPSVLFLVYTVVMFIKSLMAINMQKASDEKENIIAEYEAKKAEEERQKAETAAKLAEMEAKIAELTALKEQESKKEDSEE